MLYCLYVSPLAVIQVADSVFILRYGFNRAGKARYAD